MNKELFKELCLAFNKPADKELYNLWEEKLRCYDENEIEKAFNTIMTNDRYFPSFSRVIEVLKKIVQKEYESYCKGKLKINPSWQDVEIKSEPLDNETKMLFEDFNNFVKNFRNIRR